MACTFVTPSLLSKSSITLFPRTSSCSTCRRVSRPARAHVAHALSYTHSRGRVRCSARNNPDTSDEESSSHGIFQIGDVVRDRYRIVAVLGRGAQGITYDAIDLQNGLTPVALKVVSLRGMRSWKVLELFEREGRALQSLSHPAIPKFVDSFEIDAHGDRIFVLVQQKAEGASLQELLDSGFRFTDKQIAVVFSKLLDILQYLGSINPPMLHRDVKPANVIVNIGTAASDDVVVFLVDFGAVNTGIAKGMNSSTGLNPKSGRAATSFASTMVGTYGFMAPEQFGGAADIRSDLYSAGATILFVITGRLPSDFPQNRLQLDINSVISAPRRLELGNVYTVMRKLLEPAPEDRYQSAQAAISALSTRPSPRAEREQLYRDYYNPERERERQRPASQGNNRSSLYPIPFGDNSNGDDEFEISRPRSKNDGLFGRIQSFMTNSETSRLSRRRLRKPAGSRVSLDMDESSRLLRVDIPPRGITATTASSGAFALAWNGFVGFWTFGAVTGGAPLLFSLFSIPFWYAGAKMAKRVVDDVRSHTELVISNGGGEREVHYFSLRIAGALGDVRNVEGDSRDLNEARVDATMYVNDQPVTAIVLREGVREHMLGQDLTLPEQEWLCSEINYYLKSHKQ